MPESTARIEFPVRDTTAQTTLSSGISATETTIPVNRIAGFDDTDTPFLAKLWADQIGEGYRENAMEFVRVDSVDTSNNTLAAKRDFEGTGALSADQGDPIELMTFRASDFDKQVSKEKILDRLKLFVETGDPENVGSEKADFVAEVLNFKDFAFNSSEASVKWEYAETGNNFSNVFYDGDTVTDTKKVSTSTSTFDGSETSYSPLSESSDYVYTVAIGEGYVAYGGKDGDVYINNLSDGGLEYTFTQVTDDIRGLDIGEGYVAFGGTNDNTYVYNLNDGSLVYTLSQASENVFSVAIGEGYVVYGSLDDNAYIHDLSDGSLVYTFSRTPPEDVRGVAIGEGYVAYGKNNSNTYVHDLNDGSLKYTLSESSGVESVAIGEGYVAYGGTDNNTYVHDLADGSLVYTLDQSPTFITDVAIAEGYVAYSIDGNFVYAHDLSDGSLKSTFTKSSDEVNAVSIGEGCIAYGSQDNNIYVHNVASGPLNPNTQYKYRAIAEIGGETRKGKVKRFKTTS